MVYKKKYRDDGVDAVDAKLMGGKQVAVWEGEMVSKFTKHILRHLRNNTNVITF